MPWTFYNSNGQRLSSAATNISVLDIDGATDIGADIVDADLFIIDDGAGGTNRKTAASRLKTYVGSAISLTGSNLTLTNTTSTSVVDLFAISSLNIDKATPLLMRYNGTKDATSANYAACGLKINAVDVGVAGTGSARAGWQASNSQAIQYGGFSVHFGGVGSNILIPASSGDHIAWGASGGDVRDGPANGVYQQAAAPNAATTALTITGLNQTGNNNLGVDDLYVYQYSIS